MSSHYPQFTEADVAAMEKSDAYAEELDERRRDARKAALPDIKKLTAMVQAQELRIRELETTVASCTWLEKSEDVVPASEMVYEPARRDWQTVTEPEPAYNATGGD